MVRHRPPRVVALLENNPYPFDIRVRQEALALKEAGYDMTVICPREGDQPWHETMDGVQVYRFPLPPTGTTALHYVIEFFFNTLVMTLLCLWVWARHGMDVIHIYSPPDTLFFATILPKLAGKTVVYDNRDLSPEVYETKFDRADGLMYRFILWLERRATRQADQCITTNESYRQVLMERHDLDPDRITAIRIGPELERLRITNPDPELASRGETIIAYLGQMGVQDGVDHLLRALQHLDADLGQRDWFCILIGPADDAHGLQSLAERLGIGPRTWFTGFISEEKLLSYLSTADICVDPDPANPLNNISTMIKLMEYMALGKPTVAYSLTEHRVTGGDAVLYAEPNNELDLARQIDRLIRDPELRAKLGQMGYQRVQQKLAWPYQKERFLALYEELTQWQPRTKLSSSVRQG